MEIDLSKLINDSENITKFNKDIIFNKEDLKKIEILDIKECNISGSIKKYGEELYNINMVLKGIMILECSISLEETEYPFEINIDKTFSLVEENEENLKINANILDIFPIIWENIVLEKPSRIVKENNNGIKSGEGWSLTDEIKKEDNSQLSDLNKLLDMEERK